MKSGFSFLIIEIENIEERITSKNEFKAENS
jgi:hypothetical protein